MLINNLDPDVAERWEDLVVYGGCAACRHYPGQHAAAARLLLSRRDARRGGRRGGPGWRRAWGGWRGWRAPRIRKHGQRQAAVRRLQPRAVAPCREVERHQT